MISFIAEVVYLLIVFILMYYAVGENSNYPFFESLLLVSVLSIIPTMLGVLIGMNWQKNLVLNGRGYNKK